VLTLIAGSLERGGQVYFRALNSRVTVARVADGLLAKGTLTQEQTRGPSTLETLQAPFEILLSHKLQPLKAAIPALNARVTGIAVNGRLGYNAKAAVPFNLDLRLPTGLF